MKNKPASGAKAWTMKSPRARGICVCSRASLRSGCQKLPIIGCCCRPLCGLVVFSNASPPTTWAEVSTFQRQTEVCGTESRNNLSFHVSLPRMSSVFKFHRRISARY